MSAPFPPDERERLRALARYSVLDTPPEEAFDEITALAAEICGTPIALVSLVDAHRQWFKSKVGLDADETPRELAFCAHAILGDAIFEVPNALDDPRFADNPLVTGAPDIRFYAGAPLVTNDGFRLGTLCVIDRVPRSLDEFQLRALRTLGRQVISQLELRATAAALARRLLEAEARDATESLALADAATDGMSGRTFLARVTHDLRTPLNAILGFAEYLGEDEGMEDAERRAVAGNIREAGGFMLRLVNDILDLASLDAGAATFTRAPVDLAELAASTLEGVRPLASARGDVTKLRNHLPPGVAVRVAAPAISFARLQRAAQWAAPASVGNGDTGTIYVQKIELLLRPSSPGYVDVRIQLEVEIPGLNGKIAYQVPVTPRVVGGALRWDVGTVARDTDLAADIGLGIYNTFIGIGNLFGGGYVWGGEFLAAQGDALGRKLAEALAPLAAALPARLELPLAQGRRHTLGLQATAVAVDAQGASFHFRVDR